MVNPVAAKQVKEKDAGLRDGHRQTPPGWSAGMGRETAALALQSSAGNQATSQVLQSGLRTGRSIPEGLPPIVSEVLQSPGRPLDPKSRELMECSFGYDLRQVRVHTDKQAAASAAQLSADAYTASNHLVFGAHKYAPESRVGKQLLAHELAHVVQTSEASTNAPPGMMPPGSKWEIDADKASSSVTRGQQYRALMGAPAAVYRQTHTGVAVAGWLSEKIRKDWNRVRFALRIGKLMRRNHKRLVKNLDNAPSASLGGIMVGMQKKISRNEWPNIRDRLMRGQVPGSDFQTGFLAGMTVKCTTDIYEQLKSLVSLVQIVSKMTEDEVFARLEKGLEFLSSAQAERVFMSKGVEVGEEFAKDLKKQVGKSDIKLGYHMGEKFGPIVAEIVMSFVTFGGAAAAAWTARAAKATLGILSRAKKGITTAVKALEKLPPAKKGGVKPRVGSRKKRVPDWSALRRERTAGRSVLRRRKPTKRLKIAEPSKLAEEVSPPKKLRLVRRKRALPAVRESGISIRKRRKQPGAKLHDWAQKSPAEYYYDPKGHVYRRKERYKARSRRRKPRTGRPPISREEQMYGLVTKPRLGIKTPSKRLQKWAKQKLPIGSKDPAFPNRPALQKPGVPDHIVPVDEIGRMRDFPMLNTSRQSKIMNLKENFVAMSSEANESRGRQSFRKWKRSKKYGDVDERFRNRMIKTEEELREKIEKMILTELKEQYARRENWFD